MVVVLTVEVQVYDFPVRHVFLFSGKDMDLWHIFKICHKLFAYIK